MAKDKLADHLKKSKIYVFSANAAAAILFFLAYYQSGSIWFLVVAIVNILVIAVSFWFFIKVEKRYANLMNLKSKSLRDMYDKE